MIEIDIYMRLYGKINHERDLWDTWTVSFVPRKGELLKIEDKLYPVYRVIHTKTKVEIYIEG